MDEVESEVVASGKILPPSPKSNGVFKTAEETKQSEAQEPMIEIGTEEPAVVVSQQVWPLNSIYAFFFVKKIFDLIR